MPSGFLQLGDTLVGSVCLLAAQEKIDCTRKNEGGQCQRNAEFDEAEAAYGQR